MTCMRCGGPDQGTPTCDRCEEIADFEADLEANGVHVEPRDRSEYTLIRDSMSGPDPADVLADEPF